MKREQRIYAFQNNGLLLNERVLAVVYANPSGTLTNMTIQSIVGMIFSGIFEGLQRCSQVEGRKSLLSESFPKTDCIIVVTDQRRVLVYQQSKATLKPQSLLKVYQKGDFWIENVKKGLLRTKVRLSFADGGQYDLEVTRSENINNLAKLLKHQP